MSDEAIPTIELAVPAEFSNDAAAEAIEIVQRALRDYGVRVVDTGGRTSLSSQSPPLDFIIALVHNPVMLASGAYVALKLVDVTIDVLARPTIERLVGNDKKGLSTIIRALYDRYGPKRRVQVLAEVDIGDWHTRYFLPDIDEVDHSVFLIPDDLARIRHERHPQRLWYAGRWNSYDEFTALHRAELRELKPPDDA